MAYTQDGDRFGAPAAADFSAEGAGQYRAVKRDAAGSVVLCAANDTGFEGILQDTPAVGRTATVKTMATSKAVIGAAVVNGALLTSDAAGRFVTATVGQRVLARAHAAGSGTGVIIPVRIQNGLSTAP